MNERVVVVTGAGSGIGRAIAELHADEGWTVVGVERDAAACAALRTELPGVIAVEGDVSNDAVLLEARDRAVEAGRLMAWVNNAAALGGRPLTELDDEHIESMLATNVRAVLNGTRFAVDEFLRSGTPGSIVCISSIHARLSFAGHTMYDTSKGAVEALCRVVAAEMGPRGIRCNAVAPGAVMTEREVAARLHGPLPHEPIPRAMFSTPAQIASVVAFLTSEASVAINGAVIAADRGLSVSFLDQHWHSADARG